MNDEVRNFVSADSEPLLDFLNETPAKLSQLTDDLPVAELCWKNSEDEFSALESICHLRDLELRGYAPRIRRILDETDPALADFDGARVAAEGDYHSQQPDQTLRSFAEVRQENVRTLRGLTEEQRKREGTLEGVGKITLIRLAELMREHDEGHLEELRILQQRLERRRSR